jgi:hypothetical protein
VFYTLPFASSCPPTSTSIARQLQTDHSNRNRNRNRNSVQPTCPHSYMTSMILRFTSREGQFRLNVEPTATFTDIIPQIAEKLPANVDISSISVSNKPHGGESRKLTTLKGVPFKQVNLS